MIDLDEVKNLKKYDKSDMLKLLESFPQQCRAAKKIADAFNLPSSFKKEYKNILCTGLGGSAIGADIVRSYISDEARLPVFVNRNYTLPAFIGEESLVIATSYSGNTEETLSAYKDARARKAAVIAITSGGELEKLAKSDGFPVLLIPGGLPPRCALGYSSFTLLALFSKLEIIGRKDQEIAEAIKTLEDIRDKSSGSRVRGGKNIAKRIAREFYGKYPIIYGGQDRIDAVVTRWRGQIAENSKALSSSHVLPEMNHNEIVGWENPGKLIRNFIVMILRDREDHPRTSLRMDITKKIIEKERVRVLELSSEGKSSLARIYSLIYTGDFTSYYLAVLNRRDPTPVDRVTYLKKELAKS